MTFPRNSSFPFVSNYSVFNNCKCKIKVPPDTNIGKRVTKLLILLERTPTKLIKANKMVP